MRFEVSKRNYDAVIIAPGPTVDHFKYCFSDLRSPGAANNISMIWFGVSVALRDEITFQKQQNCLKLLTMRESNSYQMVRKWRSEAVQTKEDIARKRHPDKDIQLLLSGDLSFSFRALESEVLHHKKRYMEKLKSLLSEKAKDWIVLFSRKNNFGPEKGGQSVYLLPTNSHFASIPPYSLCQTQLIEPPTHPYYSYLSSLNPLVFYFSMDSG